MTTLITASGEPVILGTGQPVNSWGLGMTIQDPGVPLSAYVSSGGLITNPIPIWRSQPSLRKVVQFIARGIAVLPWHAYVRDSDTERHRVAGSPAERLLVAPNALQQVTGYQLIYDFVVDLCLYDRAAIVAAEGEDGGTVLKRIPAQLLNIEHDAFGGITRLWVQAGRNQVDLLGGPVVYVQGWSGAGAGGISPILTIAQTLDEQDRSVKWRRWVWDKGAKISGVLQADGDPFNGNEAVENRFFETWKQYRDSEAGGTPYLRGGLKYQPIDGVTPRDATDIEGRQLADAEVASFYGIAPELVGAREGTFSNVDAFRQMLYGPALGPTIRQIQQAINMSLVPALDPTPLLYVEADKEAGMQGSLMEQASATSTSVGGPWLTVNEVRASRNLPPVEGGEALISPLNVARVGGPQASPQDSGEQNQKAITPAQEAALTQLYYQLPGLINALVGADAGGES